MSDKTMPICAICQKEFIPGEHLHKMVEKMPVAGTPQNYPDIPFIVLVHMDCCREYEFDRDHRPFRIAEQVYPFARRSWA